MRKCKEESRKEKCMPRIKDKVVVITGASGGIGEGGHAR